MNKCRRLTCVRNSSVHLSLKHLLKHLLKHTRHRIRVTLSKSIQIPFIADDRTCYIFRPYAIFKEVVMVKLQCKLRRFAQIAGPKSPRSFLLRWPLSYVGHQHETCCMSTFCCLKFPCDSHNFIKFVHPELGNPTLYL
jgi:hypothetical protein